MTRPILRYHGGKFLLAPWIVSYLPPHRVFVEPFAGAASVLLSKPQSKSEVLNDLDGEIVSLFRVLRDPAQARELRRVLELTPYARAEFELAYSALACDPIEAARRLIVRSHQGIGTNASTQGIGKAATGWRNHVEPNGDLRANNWARYPDELQQFVERLRGVVIDNVPATTAIAHYDSSETVFYLDPPYPKSTRSDNGNDYRFEMTDADHIELAEVLNRIEGMAVLSGYPSALYDENLFADWHRVSRAATTHQGQARTECLWLNARAWNRLQAPATGLFAEVNECNAA